MSGHKKWGDLKTERQFTPVVTICGSMRFFDEMLNQAKTLSLRGYVVIMPFVTFTGDEQLSVSKMMLDQLHYRKIDMSHGIFVVNPGGYVGQSTQNEINYAKEHNKTIMFLEQKEEDND